VGGVRLDGIQISEIIGSDIGGIMVDSCGFENV
jgi:hypothetical protein